MRVDPPYRRLGLARLLVEAATAEQLGYSWVDHGHRHHLRWRQVEPAHLAIWIGDLTAALTRITSFGKALAPC